MTIDRRPVSFIATAKAEQALAFYRDVIGLSLVAETPFAIIFNDCGHQLRIQKVPRMVPVPYTSFGWFVTDIYAEIERLRDYDVEFEEFDMVEQDAAMVWTVPDGAKVAWFRDPDGNLLSLTQEPPIG
ncbi:VOC family protein [Alteraurantiacibacter aestuarii]|uniref:VOC family protein n=1 Tax=Alteraurantiacibacter aestuarii TaxID=650004 RepID=A0A844ZI42_9SPHN|nr:VOC family protein [Alteraurantiacibacter aestuarii]MXO87475.1 VOC family protein [Alteraurantiacibacter aestuarii]